jgi:hypothetical protein
MAVLDMVLMPVLDVVLVAVLMPSGCNSLGSLNEPQMPVRAFIRVVMHMAPVPMQGRCTRTGDADTVARVEAASETTRTTAVCSAYG